MSRKLDRLEESLQRKGRWPKKHRRRKDVRCHRCQHPGRIARHCRAPVPVPAGRRQTLVVAISVPEGDARDSRVPTVAVEPNKRSSSGAAAVSQVSSDKRRRARRKIASPRSPDEMPDPEDPEARRAAVSCRRQNNTVPRVEPVKSCRNVSAPVNCGLRHM